MAPDKTCVYRLRDEEGVLLYVGVSLTVMQRIAHHRATKPWFTDIGRIDLVWFDTRAEALAYEADAIVAEHPVYNLAGRPSLEAEWKQWLGEIARWRPELVPSSHEDDELGRVLPSTLLYSIRHALSESDRWEWEVACRTGS